jgi:hypothetical protein
MLVGRRPETLAIDRLLADARQGRSGVLVIRGEAGIGKSALLGYAQEQAEGMTVLRGVGIESESVRKATPAPRPRCGRRARGPVIGCAPRGT